ncbi:hypothetical protein F183_A11480 [Bryobacterales bacterium F-183]|nr:hypothetical protein F183_A11480 [Bryobacterales bacterium F-183]
MTLRSVALPSYWIAFDLLPVTVKRLAEKQYDLFIKDPRHPSLQFKRVGSYWSVRVSQDYRALGVRREDAIYWFWIGLHDEYQRIIDRA